MGFPKLFPLRLFQNKVISTSANPPMKYRRMPIEAESPEEMGYGNIRCNLAESSVTDAKFSELGIDAGKLILAYGDHRGKIELREWIASGFPGIDSNDVLITAGAASALFIAATSLL